MTFLSVVVLSVALATQPQTPDARAEAERLAQSGAYAQALKQFQAIVAANPDDMAARMWIGRLQAQLGRPERAADVFRAIVAAEPQNVDALIGLGQALTDTGQYREAADVLNRAESIASDRPAVLAAQGRLHRAEGRPSLALAYYDRALLLDPSNKDARRDRDAMRAERAHRLEGTYYFEHFNTGVSDTHQGTLTFDAHVTDSLRLFGTVQQERKLDLDDTRGGGGLTWQRLGNLQVKLGGLFGSTDSSMLPNGESFFDIGYSSGPIRWLAGVRTVRFDQSNSIIVAPGLTIACNERSTVTVQYYRSETKTGDLGSRTGNNGFAARASSRIGRQFTAHVRYLRGFEGLDTITAEHTSQYDADTVALGGRLDITAMTTLGATYEHQWRSDDTRVSAFYVNLILRFK